MRLIDADALLNSTDKESVHAWEIALAPTIEAEPIRHGSWILYESETDNRWRKCSVCGTADEYINEYGAVAHRRFCPFCGAKMDEVIEDETN